MTDDSPHESTLVALARMEGKLDLVLANAAAADRRLDDHEHRIRLLEQKPVITRNGLLAAVVSTATLVGVATSVFANLSGR